MSAGSRAAAALGDDARGEIAVIGLARSGRAVTALLAQHGATVYASDGGTSDALQTAKASLTASGAFVDLGLHDLERIRRASLVVVSPGVPPDAPPLVAARSSGAKVVSEIEIALRFLPNLAYIGITGTNGKTTTTTLAAQLLEAVGRRAIAAGNIGTPLSEVALMASPPDWAALELSSFQLHDTYSVRPRVGIITNLSANHLDRYPTLEAYYGDKALLFRNATDDSQWVTNADDAPLQGLAAPARGTHLRFSLAAAADAWLDRDAQMLVVLGRQIIRRDDFPLVGDHNVANALAAALAVMAADPSHRTAEAVAAIGASLASAAPLHNRIEPVATGKGITWINDSKSTNVASTEVALRGMTRPTVLLLGGRHKGDPYTPLRVELERIGRHVIAYGEAAEIIARDLDGVVPMTRLQSSFDDVIARAAEVAEPGDVVLLSPACSSFDMFTDYEQRGREFARLARARAE